MFLFIHSPLQHLFLLYNGTRVLDGIYILDKYQETIAIHQLGKLDVVVVEHEENLFKSSCFFWSVLV